MAISGSSPTLRASNSVPATLAFAQNQRDEVRLLGGDGDVAGTVSAQTLGTHKNETLLADCLTPWDVQSKRVHSENGVSPTLASGTGEGMNIQPVVMASTHTNAEIGRGGVSPTLTAHNQKDAPVLVTGTTCSPRSAPLTEASSSSTTRASGAEDLCSTPDRRGFDDCVASNGEDVIGALCARDFKGVGSQYVGEGKVIMQRDG